jgi:hypothetical protein
VDAKTVTFKFNAVDTRGSEKLVADCLSCMFELSYTPADQLAVTLLQSVLASFENVKDNQGEDPFCHDLSQHVSSGGSSRYVWQIHQGLVFSVSSGRRDGES